MANWNKKKWRKCKRTDGISVDSRFGKGTFGTFGQCTAYFLWWPIRMVWWRCAFLDQMAPINCLSFVVVRAAYVSVPEIHSCMSTNSKTPNCCCLIQCTVRHMGRFLNGPNKWEQINWKIAWQNGWHWTNAAHAPATDRGKLYGSSRCREELLKPISGFHSLARAFE